MRLPNGDFDEKEVPLTAEDLLDPQFGDHMVQGGTHVLLVHDLFVQLLRRYRSQDDVLVCSDMKMHWGVPGLPEPAPDIAVVRGVRDKTGHRNSFDVVLEGIRPRFVLEVVSPLYPEQRRNDREKKVAIYQKLGIEEYFIVDPSTADARYRLDLIGYRLDHRGLYRPIQPDAQGRLLSETTGLWFSISESGQQVLLVDAMTGERLLTSFEEESARQAEEARRRTAEAELASLREELARWKSGLGSR